MHRDAGSFRDPSGFVFRSGATVLRTINHSYREEWEHHLSTGLLDEAVRRGMLIPFKEASAERLHLAGEDADQVWKVLQVETVPFLSYPYEWCFSQLKDAALLTLSLHMLALEHECILKDASAFNVQYVRGKAVFIDTLSFERWQNGQPWQAYGQFCSHFLAPLALMAKQDLRCNLLSRQWIHGIPLDLACRLLPFSSRFSPGLFLHLHLHAAMQQRHADSRTAAEKVRSSRLSLQKMKDVAQSLVSAVESLRLPARDTEWGDYYDDTNYTPEAAAAKERIIKDTAARCAGELAVDLGANTGRYSALLAPFFPTVVAADIDPLAVERHYRKAPRPSLLPLILDVMSPSPALGWACSERMSFPERCQADMLLALALCHHLAISGGIPLSHIAEFTASLLRPGGIAVVEFVPREDSQVRRLLATRDDIFTEYSPAHLSTAFARAGLQEEERHDLPTSLRTLHVFRKNAASRAL